MENAYNVNKTVTLSDGTKMPRIDYGTYQFTGTAVPEFVRYLIKLGSRHIDIAKFYANEAQIGEGLKLAFAEGLVKREDLYITTKLRGSDKIDPEAALKESLKDLQLEYLDLLLIHFPSGTVDAATNLLKQIPLHITWVPISLQKNKTQSLSVM